MAETVKLVMSDPTEMVFAILRFYGSGVSSLFPLSTIAFPHYERNAF